MGEKSSHKRVLNFSLTGKRRYLLLVLILLAHSTLLFSQSSAESSVSFSVPTKTTNSWTPWVYSFNISIPEGNVITRINFSFSGVDQGWGGTNWNGRFQINEDVLGYARLTHSYQNFNVEGSDTDLPTITLNGSNSLSVEAGSGYTDLGATVQDVGKFPNFNKNGNNELKFYFCGYSGWASTSKNGVLTIYHKASSDVSLVTTGSVDSNVVGNYTITYTATDQAGNSSTATRQVNVIDTTAPVISINGNSTFALEAGGTYSDSGATATDIVDGSVSVITTGSVDSNAVGNYTITYTATDQAGNSSTATRQVNVIDTTAPVISINGNSTFALEAGGTYSDSGATATDIVDGSVSVITTGSVDSNVVGNYTITYTA
ncbi:MAG: immunoglobulin-like domain-containing protein, partial [Flavobacteriaceae bacterium]